MAEYLLSIDTAGAQCAVAIYDCDRRQIVASQSRMIGRGHAEFLPSLVDAALSQAGLSFSDLSRLGVTEGPGSFAGIRVGISFVRALSLALDIPANGIGSLKAMALPMAEKLHVPVLVCLDARRGQIYAYQADSMGQKIVEASAMSIADAARLVSFNGMKICGNGVPLFNDFIDEAELQGIILHLNDGPDIEDVARLCASMDVDGRRPVPQYIRPPDAKPQLNFALERI